MLLLCRATQNRRGAVLSVLNLKEHHIPHLDETELSFFGSK
jgi:hypothetical protein